MDFKNILEGTRPFFQGLPSPSTSTSIPPAHAHTLTPSPGNVSRESPLQRDSHILNHSNSHPHNLHNSHTHPHPNHSHVHPLSLNSHHGRLSTPPSLAPLILPMPGSQDGVTTMRSKYEEGLGAALSQMYTSATGPSSSQSPLNLNLSRLGLTHASHSHNQRVDTSSVDRLSSGQGTTVLSVPSGTPGKGNTNSGSKTTSANSNMVGVNVAGVRRESPLDLSVKTVRQSADSSTSLLAIDSNANSHVMGNGSRSLSSSGASTPINPGSNNGTSGVMMTSRERDSVSSVIAAVANSTTGVSERDNIRRERDRPNQKDRARSRDREKVRARENSSSSKNSRTSTPTGLLSGIPHHHHNSRQQSPSSASQQQQQSVAAHLLHSQRAPGLNIPTPTPPPRTGSSSSGASASYNITSQGPQAQSPLPAPQHHPHHLFAAHYPSGVPSRSTPTSAYHHPHYPPTASPQQHQQQSANNLPPNSSSSPSVASHGSQNVSSRPQSSAGIPNSSNQQQSQRPSSVIPPYNPPPPNLGVGLAAYHHHHHQQPQTSHHAPPQNATYSHPHQTHPGYPQYHPHFPSHAHHTPSPSQAPPTQSGGTPSNSQPGAQQQHQSPYYPTYGHGHSHAIPPPVSTATPTSAQQQRSSSANNIPPQQSPAQPPPSSSNLAQQNPSSASQQQSVTPTHNQYIHQQQRPSPYAPPPQSQASQQHPTPSQAPYYHHPNPNTTAAHYYQQAAANRTSSAAITQQNPSAAYPPYGTSPGAATAPYTHPQHHYGPPPQGISHLSAYPPYLLHQQGARPPNSTPAQPSAVASPQNYPTAQHYQSHPGLRPSTPTGPPPSTPTSTPSQNPPQALPNYSNPNQNHVQSKTPQQNQNSAGVIANNSNSNSSNGSAGSNMKPPQNPPKSGNPKSGSSRKNLLNLLRNSLETRIHEKQEKEKFQFNHQTWNFHGRKYNTTLPPINGNSSGNSSGTPPGGSHPNSPAHLSNSANGNGASSSGYSSGNSSGQSLGSNGKDPAQNVFGIGQRNSLTNYQHSKYESSSFTDANATESPPDNSNHNQVMTGPGSGGSSTGEPSSIHRIRTKAEKKQLFPNLLSQIEQENSNKANNNLHHQVFTSAVTSNNKTLATSVFDFRDDDEEFGAGGARSSTTSSSAPGSTSPKKKGSGTGTGKAKSPKKISGEIRRGSNSKKTEASPMSTFSHVVSQTNHVDVSSNQSIKKEFSSVIPNEDNNSGILSTVASDIKEGKPQTTRTVAGAASEGIDAFWAACDSFVNDLTSNPTTIKSRRGGLWQKLKVKRKPGESGSGKNRRIKRNSSEEDSDFEVEEDDEEEEEEKSEVDEDSQSESGSESDSNQSLGSEVEGRIGKRPKSNKKLHKKKKVNQISSEDDESGSEKSDTGKTARKGRKSIHSSPTGSRNGSTTVKISKSEDGKQTIKPKTSRGKGGSTISSSKSKNEIVSNGKEGGKRNKRSRSQRRRSTRKRKTVVNIGKIPGMSDLDDDEDATSRSSIGSESDLSEDSEFDGGSIAHSFSTGDSDDNSSSDDDDSDIGLDSDDSNSDESNSNSNSDDDDSLSSSSSRPGVKRKSSGKAGGNTKSKRGRSSSALLKSSNKRKGKGKKSKKSDSKTRKGRRISSRRKTRAGSKNAERSKKDSGDKENDSDNENDHLSADSDSGEINKKRGKKRKLRTRGQQREGGRKLRPKRNCAPIPGKGKLKDISGESEDEAVGSSGEEWIMRGELGKKKRRIVFGDGSDFRRPGWEEELIDFKKKLRMPSKLIRVSKPSSLSMSPAGTGTQSASSSVAGGPTFPLAKDDKDPATPKTAKENKIPTPGKGVQSQGSKGDKTPEKDDKKEKKPKGRPPKSSTASPTHSNAGSNSIISGATAVPGVTVETPVSTTPSKATGKSPAKSAKGSPKVQIKLEKIKSDSETMSEPAIEQAVQRMRAATKRDKSGGPKPPAIAKLEKEEADKVSDADESGKGKSDKEIQMLPTPGPAATKFNKKMSIKSVFGVDLPLAAKKTLRRNKFKSGFDYIRKKKKAAVLTPDGSIAPPPPKRVKTAVEKNMNVEDIQVEMRGWVLNKGLGETALHRAARLGYPDVAAYCLEHDVCSPNCKDNAGYSPLHETCIKGNLEVAKVLLSYGANPSQAAPGGIRPLHEACENGHVELVRLIISYGADPLLATYAGQTPLELAENHRSVKLLLEQHINDVQGKEEKPWEFRGSGSWAEAPFDNGYDVTADPPDEDNDNEVIDGFEFESSENPLPLLYKLKGESPDYILLQDLLTYVSQPRERFMKNHPTAEIVELNSNDFLEQAQCCHLLGEKFNLNSSSDLLTLVKYDDRVKKMLNIESCIIK